ncbi:uncharacterized protein I206_104738 [Kwoniella pini CBS 10737]|uniref:Uncharacterized protein n=1 Tax=Kwoniella pini CBS 10737 TaxID=1296096 RepID=A0A1B9I801_9TREE|nr:uncharacterized protein I206_02276 [Kwoniella pini CBS 10737]OCF51561.1 hypothetical protein I206_02276 [Kwoniella pini CBS 10737]
MKKKNEIQWDQYDLTLLFNLFADLDNTGPNDDTEYNGDSGTGYPQCHGHSGGCYDSSGGVSASENCGGSGGTSGCSSSACGGGGCGGGG